MMIEEYVTDRTTMARITGGRVELYRVLVEILGSLPDMELVGRIKHRDFGALLKGCCGIADARLDSGVQLLKSYEGRIKGKPDLEILDELSVDRTRIMRGTGIGRLRPPYEGLYSRTAPKGGAVLKLKAFYRNAGLSADEAVHESPDYLCVELAFMRTLCVREQNLWSSGGSVAQTVILEEQFLREHLGSWTGEFCGEAERCSSTEFYRGCLAILDAFISMEGGYLQELASSFQR
jgi:TorA maturation chaperone TorD